jgi:hypothetical protein
LAPALAGVLPLAASLLAAPASAQRGAHDWTPAERTVLGDFSRVSAVATTPDRVYVVTPTAVLLWNPIVQHWDGPYDPPDPATLARVIGALGDPLDNTLWVARSDGWVHFSPELRQWDRGAVPGVRDVAFDLNDPVGGLYLLTGGGWVTVPRGGGAALPALHPPARPVRPTTVEEAIRANPTLQANSAQILTDPRLRSLRYTSAAEAFDRRGWYIGTWGGGLLYLPAGAALPQRLTFGLTGDRVGALFAAPGGVWAATEQTAQSDAALTYVASDLSEFRTISGSATFGLHFDQARQLVGQGSALWAATDAGVVRVEPASGRVQLYDEGRGLPDSRALAVTSRHGMITVGTAHGLARIGDSSGVRRIAPDFADAAYAVAVAGDTTWVGTAQGVYAALPGQEGLLRPKSVGASASLQVPIIGLRFMGDTLVALSQDQLLWRDPKGGAWTLGPTLSTLLGRLRAFALDGDGFWVGGERGLAFARLKSPPIRPMISGENPGLIRDIAVDADYIWVATDSGLVRWSREAIRP